MILGTAQITRTEVNIKLYKEYSVLNSSDVENKSNISHKLDYIDTKNNDITKNDYDKILEKSKNNISIPTNPDLAIAKLDQLRKASSNNNNDINTNKNIMMGMNIMKIKLQLQEVNQS